MAMISANGVAATAQGSQFGEFFCTQLADVDLVHATHIVFERSVTTHTLPTVTLPYDLAQLRPDLA